MLGFTQNTVRFELEELYSILQVAQKNNIDLKALHSWIVDFSHLASACLSLHANVHKWVATKVTSSELVEEPVTLRIERLVIALIRIHESTLGAIGSQRALQERKSRSRAKLSLSDCEILTIARKVDEFVLQAEAFYFLETSVVIPLVLQKVSAVEIQQQETKLMRAFWALEKADDYFPAISFRMSSVRRQKWIRESSFLQSLRAPAKRRRWQKCHKEMASRKVSKRGGQAK